MADRLEHFSPLLPDIEDDLGGVILGAQEADRAASATAFLEDFSGAGPMVHEGAADNPATRIAKDIGQGVLEAPGQIVGGIVDAYDAALSGIASFDQAASEALGLPKLQIFDQEGNLDIDLLSAEKAGEAKVMGVPEIAAPESVTGGLVRGVSQFLTGFVGGSRAIGGLKGATTAASAIRGTAAGAISDFAAFDGHEARLSDLIQSYPDLQNPVTEYLATDMEDSELEGRLKNVAEGMLSDAAIAGLLTAIRSVRSARAVKARVGGESYEAAAERLARDPAVLDVMPARDVSGLRVPDAPAISRLGQDVDPQKMAGEITDFLAGRTRGADEAAGAARAADGADAATRAAAPPPAGPQVSAIKAGDGEVFINWGRINTADDVKGVIQNMADAARDEIDAARRGVRTNEATELSAEQLKAWNVLSERRVGAPLNAEQSLAVRRLWASSGEKLVEAARAVETSPTAENIFMFRRAMAMHGTIQREVIAARTETARALQQWAIPAGGDREMTKAIEDMVNMFGGEEVGENIARRIVNAADHGNLAAIDKMARLSPGAATLRAVQEYWIMSILSGPKTHLVNTMSNAGVLGLLQLERLTAAGLGAARGGTDRITAREVGASIHGALTSVGDAFRFAADSFRTGQSGFGMGKVEMPFRRAISSEMLGDTSSKAFNAVMNRPAISRGIDALGAVVGVPGRALGAADEFFKTINFRAELSALAMRQASDEAARGAIPESAIRARVAELLDEPTETMRMAAREAAQYATFTNDAGRYARAISDFRQKAPLFRFIVPFVNTPANILRFATERSPFAPLLGNVRADIAAGGIRRDQALARLGLGSMAMLWSFDAALNGKITGSGPANTSEREALMRTGWKPYALRVGDRYFAYNRLDPMGMQLGVAAELAEIALNSEEDPGDEYDETIYRTIGAIGENMMDKTYLTGLADLVGALSEPERFAPTYVERLLSSFVPTISREVATFMDPEMKRSTNTLARIRERIPGLRDDVPTRHDLWGRPISYQSGLGAGYDAVSPVYSSRSNPEPIDAELPRIGYFPGAPSRNITVDGNTISLRNLPEIYEEFMVLQGATPASDLPAKTTTRGELDARSARLRSYGNATLLETLNAIVTGEHDLSAEYADADTEGKGDLVYRVISDYRTAARNLLIERHPDVFGGK